jgi:hypothetical protein
VIERCFGHGAHQPDRAAAIDEADAVFGESLSEGRCSFDETGICARAGAAIDTDGFNGVHKGDVALRNEGVKPFRFRAAEAILLPGMSAKCKRIAAPGCMARSNALYDGQNMHMIEKTLRPQPGTPFGQA